MLRAQPLAAPSEVTPATPLNASQVQSFAQAFATADPYPYVVMDQLFPTALLDQISAEFDLMPPDSWLSYDNREERKYGSAPHKELPPVTQAYFDRVHSGPFVRMLSKISGIDDLIPDPYLHGGGMHLIPDGGKFAIHADFQKHPRTNLDKRLVLITYLNPGWTEANGGALELWARDRSACVQKVVPLMGRTLLMATEPDGFHGHPDPVVNSAGRGRRSVAAYYYTNGGRAQVGDATSITSIFMNKTRLPWQDEMKYQAKRLVPPALLDVGRRLMRKGGVPK